MLFWMASVESRCQIECQRLLALSEVSGVVAEFVLDVLFLCFLQNHRGLLDVRCLCSFFFLNSHPDPSSGDSFSGLKFDFSANQILLELHSILLLQFQEIH